MVLRRARLAFAPRLALLFQLRSERAVTLRSSLTLVHGATSTSRVERWYERLVARERRAEPARTALEWRSTADGGNAPALAVERRPAYGAPPVPLVVARRPPASPPARLEPERALPEARRPGAVAWPARLPAAPAPDLEALTDRVVQTLNRRLGAHAERLLRR
jgi:hypothetical protein